MTTAVGRTSKGSRPNLWNMWLWWPLLWRCYAKRHIWPSERKIIPVGLIWAHESLKAVVFRDFQTMRRIWCAIAGLKMEELQEKVGKWPLEAESGASWQPTRKEGPPIIARTWTWSTDWMRFWMHFSLEPPDILWPTQMRAHVNHIFSSYLLHWALEIQ